MGEICRMLRWVYLAKREKSLSPKTQNNDNSNANGKIINKHSWFISMKLCATFIVTLYLLTGVSVYQRRIVF